MSWILLGDLLNKRHPSDTMAPPALSFQYIDRLGRLGRSGLAESRSCWMRMCATGLRGEIGATAQVRRWVQRSTFALRRMTLTPAQRNSRTGPTLDCVWWARCVSTWTARGCAYSPAAGSGRALGVSPSNVLSVAPSSRRCHTDARRLTRPPETR